MLANDQFSIQSLDLNLFFLRIMKEHALFLAVAFPPKNEELIKEAGKFNAVYTDLLAKAIELAKGVVDIKDDAVTSNTVQTEKATEMLTGFPIDTKLTEAEKNLMGNRRVQFTAALAENIGNLNARSIALTRNFIRYKTKVLNGVLACKLFNANYPLLIEHIRREALLFVDLLTKLQNKEVAMNLEETINQELFWNRIMKEHSEFIRGLLDPTEEKLIEVANNFAIQYRNLNQQTENALANPNLFAKVTEDSYKLTKEINAFKIQGTEGILNCSIRSLIFPLLGDHVVRESNHFLHILENAKR